MEVPEIQIFEAGRGDGEWIMLGRDRECSEYLIQILFCIFPLRGAQDIVNFWSPVPKGPPWVPPPLRVANHSGVSRPHGPNLREITKILDTGDILTPQLILCQLAPINFNLAL